MKEKGNDVLARIDAAKEMLSSQPAQCTALQHYSSPVQGLAPACNDIGSGLEFRFGDLAQKTRDIRRVYSRIERTLRIDLSTGIERIGYALVDRIRRLAKVEVQGLAELFQETGQHMEETCMLLGNLHGACLQNNRSLLQYMDQNEDRLAGILKSTPEYIRRADTADTALASAQRRMASLERTDPAYYLARKEWRHRRIARRSANSDVHLMRRVQEDIDRIVQGTDVLGELLLGGAEFARELHASYFIAGECISQVGPSSSMVRELFRNSPVLYSLVEDVHTSLRYAYDVETRFENPSLITRAYRALPALPSNRSAAGLLDYVNAQFSAGRVRQLLGR